MFGPGALDILRGSCCRSVKDPKVVPIETTNIKQAIVILLWRWTHFGVNTMGRPGSTIGCNSPGGNSASDRNGRDVRIRSLSIISVVVQSELRLSALCRHGIARTQSKKTTPVIILYPRYVLAVTAVNSFIGNSSRAKQQDDDDSVS